MNYTILEVSLYLSMTVLFTSWLLCLNTPTQLAREESLYNLPQTVPLAGN